MPQQSPSPSPCLDENTALELLDGKLASAARSKVERHLEGCDACRELVAELAKSDAQDGEEDDDREVEGFSADTERTPFAQQAALAALSRVGPYRIEHAIGSGAAGTVYRAVDERTNQVIALKMVTDAGLRARFKREATILSRLNHPAIVRYIGHGDSPGGMYLAMEWLEGEDLQQRLLRGPLGWQGARQLGLRLSAALGHAHSLGCVHRDMSPRNVFLPGRQVEEAKLLDFGLVRTEGGLFPGGGPTSSRAYERTSSQALLGTPFYMSPEQVRDPKSVDARADLFGLGVLLFEAVSGVRPFRGDDLFSIWVQIVDYPTPDLRIASRESVPEAMVVLIEALLAKEPSARPASASDVHRVLSTMMMNVPTAGGPPITPITTATTTPHGSGAGVRAGAATVAMPSTPPLHITPGMVGMPPAPPLQTQPYQRPPLPSHVPASHPHSHSHSHSGHPSHPVPPHVAAMQHPMQHVNAQSIPIPPRGRSGVYIAAGVGVSVALVTVTTVGVYAARHGGLAAATSSGQAQDKKTAGTPTDVNGQPLSKGDDSDDDDDDSPPAKPVNNNTSNNKKDAAPAKPRVGRYMCGADTVETKRGGHYEPDPDMSDVSEAVWVGGDCKATLEDCVIGGKNSVLVLGSGQLTLRRCRVMGAVKLVGQDTRLYLEGTTLPSAPEIVGKGKVTRR